MADWNNILSENSELLSDEELLKYLDHTLTEAQKYKIEKKLSASSFESDALEGLQKIDDPRQLQSDVKQLNKKLRQQLSPRSKKRRPRQAIQLLRWILLAILVLLLVCIISFVIITW